MITHFTYRPFFSPTSRRQEFRFSFFYKGAKFSGIYHYNGAITWDDPPDEADLDRLTTEIHALMLFHVYDR